MTEQNPNQIKDLQNEFSTLDRVSHRLAMTDGGAPLEKVLSLLLPRLLSRIGKNDDAKRENRRGLNKRKLSANGENVDSGEQEKLDEMYETIHKKLIDMLMHVMKRVRDDRDCKLPCGAISDLLASDTNAFTVNLSLAFLTLGVNRCTPLQCSNLLPGMLEFLELQLIGSNESTSENSASSRVGVDHLIDASRKMRYNQTYHLILRCFEKVSYNPLQSSAARRAAKSESSLSNKSANDADESASIAVSSLSKTKELLLSRPVIAAATFDMFLDIFLYAPVPATSTLIPNGMSTSGYQCLVGGAASENSGSKSWKDEFSTRTKLKELKLKMLDMIAPCRRFAIFLRDDVDSSEKTTDVVNNKQHNFDGLCLSRTVALMVLLCGDADIDVKSKAESYLKAHMDTYRGKEASRLSGFSEGNNYDPLIGNQVALANSILAYAVGGISSNSILTKAGANYKTDIASEVSQSRLGIVYGIQDGDDAKQKCLLSCSRMKLADSAVAPPVKFVSKILEDSPKLFHVMDMANDEADVAAVCIGSLAVSLFGDLWKPGSSSSLAVEAAASLLNALCLRLSLFYESREHASSARLQSLLSRSMSLACSVLRPTASGESASSSNTTRVGTIQIEIRDKMYGVICTLARCKRCSLDEGYSIFDCGNCNEKAGTFTFTSTAKLLFGCTTNEVEALRPRSTSALDALLAAYVRVVKKQTQKLQSSEPELIIESSSNPWASKVSCEAQPQKTSEQSDVKEFSPDGLSLSILPLLWSAARRGQTKSSRLCAARWSQELLLLIDSLNTYHLLCFLSGDEDSSISTTSKKALYIHDSMGQDVSLTTSSMSNLEYKADFSELVITIMGQEKMNSRPRNDGSPTITDPRWQISINSRPNFDRFHIRSQAGTLRFLLQVLLSEGSFYGDEKMNDYVSTILKTLASYKHRSLSMDEIDLLDECSICLAACVTSSPEARQVVKLHGVEGIADEAIKSNSSKARRHFAKIMMALYEDQTLWTNPADSLSNESSMSTLIYVSGLIKDAKSCRDILTTMTQASFVLGEVHGAAFLGSSCVRAFRLAATTCMNETALAESWDVCSDIIILLGKGLSHGELVVGNACSKGLMIAFGYCDQDAPVLDSRLYEAMATALNEMNRSLIRFSSIDHADPQRAASLILASGVLLAASTSGAGHQTKMSAIDLGPARLQCIESLFNIVGSAVHRKDDELSLVVGESLVKYADAIGDGDWSSTSNGSKEEGSYDETVAHSLPPHRHILYTIIKREIMASNPIKKTGCAALLLAIVGHASRLALLDSSFCSRTMIKEVSNQLQEIQHSFIQLLKDTKSKQLARECCCRGLAACRGLSLACGGQDRNASNTVSDRLNELLLKAFGQTSNYGRSAMMESEEQARERRNQEDNDVSDAQQIEVGGAAGMGEAALGAYREMANAAMAIDRPDLLYTLLILSTNHPIWVTADVRDRYNTKSLLGHAQGVNDEEIRIALTPHIKSLIPSLLRACNDPNKQTRDQMNALWVGLTGGGSDARDLITRHLIPTLDALIKDASSKLWRTRAGACGALSDIIVARSWEELGGGDVEEDEGDVVLYGASIRLLKLWKASVRALDDVRTPVRERGDSLARALRALTIRLCDPSAANFMTAEEEAYLTNDQRKELTVQSEKNAAKAATVSLGWLVKYGLNQPCAEATGICVSCLLGIVDIAKPTTLQPTLDSLIGALLMALSGLEPGALNYLQVRAAGNDEGSSDNYDRLESARVKISQSGPIFEALQKCLDMIKCVDLHVQKKIVPEFDSALRRGAGFATRAAVADAVTSLCSICPNAFVFPGLSTSNPSVRLFRALYFASERERGVASKDRMTHALGSLAELVPSKAVRTLAAKACQRYLESSGSNNDPSVRKAAAATVRAIVVRATSQMQTGGPKDVWAKVVLPTAFLGRHDKDEKVKALWNDVWEEGGAAIGNRDDGFGVLLQEKILPSLTPSIIASLQSTSWSNRLSACAVITELTNANILGPAPCPVDGMPDHSSERFRVRASASHCILFECVTMIARSRIWTGKGEVVKAAASIAGNWAGFAQTNKVDCDTVPLLFGSDSQDDLFVGDSWFKTFGGGAEQVDEDQRPECDEEEQMNAEDDIPDNDDAFDLKDEAIFYDEEEVTSNDTSEGTSKIKSISYVGFCKLLCNEGLRASKQFAEGVLPYKSAVFGSLSSFLRAIIVPEDSENRKTVICQQRLVYEILAPRIYDFVSGSCTETQAPPLLVAKALECWASAFYQGVGDQNGPDYANSLVMLTFFADCSGAKQPAWSVRENGLLAASSLVSKMPSCNLRKNNAITTILDCSSHSLNDKKFWKVRKAGLELLLSLVHRVGKQKVSDQLLLEAVLPYKERIVGMARQSLSDNESQVTATASQITLAMAPWP